ncbi:toll/interleukin-1 receptor domain-containing protein [Pseudonocardia humida]|uniref:Toll/interleukin-1 receptor domain-containing protein n=1 Tax=Pseudonocardia humida TaxID=2800819 RepID=A0ABT1A2A2_9PSEU|nr:toll/interleukin-1 receptor domain-containing protein [Pseudonocardia humida]MCO1657120.1 toll/interleukin-1 receptor domain-containing protein [Pseudonocardia humida]
MRVFVSHAGRDRAWAEWIAWQLDQARIETELDSWDWQTGENFVERMNTALARADAMVAVFSQAYFDPARWTAEEWQAAVHTAKQRPRFLRPVRIDDTPVPPLLAGLLSTSLHGLSVEAARQALLDVVRPPGRSSDEPGFPGFGRPAAAVSSTEGPQLPGLLSAGQAEEVLVRNEAFTGCDTLAGMRKGLRGGGGVQALSGAVFISYRRSDQPALAGRLYDKLESKFGQDGVFMDVDSIDLGSDFVAALDEALARCKAMVVVIGSEWLNVRDDDGVRRLDQPDDLVRLEIETALERGIRVIPILVDGTRMPRAQELPEGIRALSRRNGRDVSNARFKSDCVDLVSTLERLLGEAKPPAPPASPNVLRYIRDVHNRISWLADAAIGDQLETVRTEDKIDVADFVTILAPTQRLNAEFALKVAWEEDLARLARQVSAAKRWMRDHGMWGVIATRRYVDESVLRGLNFHSNERHIQLLLWRGPQDDRSLEMCLRRIAGSHDQYPV